jgi:hypothetical protein
MSSENVKQKIYKVLDNLPEEVLEDIFIYLKTVKKRSMDNITSSKNFKRILEEDKNLLERLAQ